MAKCIVTLRKRDGPDDYVVVSAENTTSPRIHEQLREAQVDVLIAKGYTVKIRA